MWTEAGAFALVAAITAGAALAQAPVGEPPGAPEEPETPAANGETQEDSESPDAKERPALFQATLVVGGAHDRLESDGAPGAEFEDDIYVAGADIALGGRLSERTDLALEYAPEFEQFADGEEDDTLHHLAGARLAHRLTQRWGVSVVGSFLDTDDPGRFLDDALLLLRRTPYRQVTGLGGIDYRGRDGGVRLEAGRIDTRVEPASGPFVFGLDQTEEIATLGADRTIGPRSGLFASYSYVTIDAHPLVDSPIDPPTDPPTELNDPLDEPIQQLSAGWRFSPVEALSLLLSAGVLDDGVEQSWIGAAEIARRGKASEFRLRYDRTAATLGGQISGSAPASGAPSGAIVRGGLTETATLAFTIGVGRRFTWEQSLRAMRTELPGIAGDLDSLAARGEFAVEAFRALDLFLAVDWFEQESLAIPSASRLRATVGLRFGLVGPPRTFDVLAEPAAPPRPGAVYQTGGLQ